MEPRVEEYARKYGRRGTCGGNLARSGRPSVRETIRKLCATCNVEKEKAHFSGTQRGKRATAKKKCKDCVTTAGEPENARPPGSEGREGSPEEADGSERGQEPEIAGADALEPGRKGGRAKIRAIRKLCATCRVGEERADFGGTQRVQRAAAKRQCRDCLTTTGFGASAMRHCRGCQ